MSFHSLLYLDEIECMTHLKNIDFDIASSMNILFLDIMCISMHYVDSYFIGFRQLDILIFCNHVFIRNFLEYFYGYITQ